MLILAATVLAAAPARATEVEGPPGTGALTAMGRDGRPLGACPLKHTDVAREHRRLRRARRRDADLRRTRSPSPSRRVYTFPLSERAAVDAMTMQTGERDHPRRDQAARGRASDLRGRAPRRPGRGAARPGAAEHLHPVDRQPDAGRASRDSTRVRRAAAVPRRDLRVRLPDGRRTALRPRSPTGHDGTGWAPDTDRVPDASRITPPVTPQGTRAGHDLSITVDVDAGVPIREVTSAAARDRRRASGPDAGAVTLRDQRRDPQPRLRAALRGRRRRAAERLPSPTASDR